MKRRFCLLLIMLIIFPAIGYGAEGPEKGQGLEENGNKTTGILESKEDKPEDNSGPMAKPDLPNRGAIYIAVISIFIALLSMLVAGYTVYKTNRNFLLSNRPYVMAKSGISEDGAHMPNSIRIVCFTTPAKIINGYIRYYIENDGKEIQNVGESTQVKKQIVSPDPQVEIVAIYAKCNTADFDKIANSLESGCELRRELKIEYTWPGKSVKKTIYSYLATWVYKIKEDYRWDTINEDVV